MAVNPYFTFADPALQQAVVQEAQVAAAARAAQAQQRAATLAALRNERQVASDREERRAIREADIRRLDANEAERRRQFDINTGLTREDIASREKIAGSRTREIDNRDLYNNLLKIVESDDPPTLKELEARMIDLTDAQKKNLLDRRNSKAASKKLQFKQSVNEANRLRGLIGTVKDGKTLTADDVLRGSPWKNVLQVTPDGLGFESLLSPPREDAVFNEVVPQPSPGFVPRDTDFRVPLQPGQGPLTAPAAEPIGAVQDRLNAGQPMGFWRALINPASVFHPAMAFDSMARVGRAMAAPRAPTDQGILAPLDYSGPEFDYGRPRFAVPPQEDILAPPVFIPPY